jgi:hypothetical protein
VPLDYLAPPTVKRFLESDARHRCILGPFGSGKSSGCDMEIPRRMAAQAPDKNGIKPTRWVIVRNTRPQLRDTARRTFDAWLGQFGEWREQPTEFKFRKGSIECEVLFRALDTPKDVRNLLSLEVTGAYFNELREIAKDVYDAMDGRIGRFPEKKRVPCTWRGIWNDSNPWHTGSWQDKFFTEPSFGKDGRPRVELFRQPSGLDPDAENLENLEGGRDYYEQMCVGKSQEWIDVNVRGLNAVADEGSIFGKWIERLRARGGLQLFQHPTHDIFTCWDLGLADQTSIFWWRVTPTGVEILDWYENQGEDLEHYFAEVDRRAQALGMGGGLGFRYVKHWLPHDAAQRTLAAGTSVLSRFLQRYGAGLVAIGPNLTVRDGIDAGRWLLQQPGTRFHARAAAGLEKLSQYRFEWNSKTGVYAKNPLHDHASHTGDSFRYVANVAKATRLIMGSMPGPSKRIDVGGISLRKPEIVDPLPKYAIRPDGKLNVDLAELFAESDRRRRR